MNNKNIEILINNKIENLTKSKRWIRKKKKMKKNNFTDQSLDGLFRNGL